MIDAQSPVAIRALPDLCLGIILQLDHLRLPTNLVQMASPGSSRARGGGALSEIAPELTGHGLPLSKCEAYNRVYDQFYQSR
jgi:hypothetical protein